MNWLPAITTTGVFAVALWLCKKLIATRLTKSVEHEFNEKLEKIRADLRASEELLKAELRAGKRDHVIAWRRIERDVCEARCVGQTKAGSC